MVIQNLIFTNHEYFKKHDEWKEKDNTSDLALYGWVYNEIHT